MNRQYTTTCSDTFQPRGHIERMEDKIILPRKETKAKCWDDILLLARHPREDKEMASPEDSSFKNQAAVCPPPPPAAGPAARRDSLQDMIMKCSEAEGRCWDDILSLAAATISNTSSPAAAVPAAASPPTTTNESRRPPTKSILRHSTGNIDDSDATDSYNFTNFHGSVSFNIDDDVVIHRSRNKSVHFPLSPGSLVRSVHVRPRTDILDVPLLHYTPKDIKKFRREYERRERTEIFRRATSEQRLERERQRQQQNSKQVVRREKEGVEDSRQLQLQQQQQKQRMVFRDVVWDDDHDDTTGHAKTARSSLPVHWPSSPSSSRVGGDDRVDAASDTSSTLDHLAEQCRTTTLHLASTLYLF